MSKYGSSSVLFLVDGYDMSVNKLQGLSYKVQSLTEPTHGIGDTWEEHTPVGLSKAELSQEGAFFDSSTSGGFLHVLQSTSIGGQGPSSTEKVVCIGVAGNTSGQPFIGLKGEFQSDYEVLGSVGKLTRANASYVVTGNAEHGQIIRPLTATTADATNYLDNGVATANGGAAYFQVTSLSLGASTGVALTVLDASSSAAAYTAVATVTVSAVGAYRVASGDASIDRWLSSTVDFSSAATSGSPSITCFIGFSRL